MILDLARHTLELVVLTLTRGSLYSLIALGFALVFGTGRVLNLFHGGFFLLGAYLAFFFASLPLPLSGQPKLIAATGLAALAVSGFAYLYYQICLRHFLRQPISLMVVGVLANLLTAQILSAAYGTQAATLPAISPGTLRLNSTPILRQELLIGAVALSLFAVLSTLLVRTKAGAAIQAVAQDSKGARLVGIEPDTVLGSTMALAGLLAGLSGALAAPVQVVSPDLWSFALVKAFTIVILGGIGSLRGTLFAAYGLAAVELLCGFWIGQAGSDLVALLVAVATLAVRPKGLIDELA